MKAKRNGHAVPLYPAHPEPGNGQVQILIGTPTLGIVNIEWHSAMAGLTAPPNWASVRAAPKGYVVADAQNILCDVVLKGPFRALLLIEDDTIPPPETLIVMDRWLWKMERKKAPPVVSGIYHIKGSAEVRRGKNGGIELLGPEPLAYRGSGQRAFRDFTYGDVIWVSGVPTGALLVHRSVIETWAREPDVPEYALPGVPTPIKRIFQNPSRIWTDSTGTYASAGTSDLWWSDETIKRGILEKAGYGAFYRSPKIRKATEGKYPFVIDTSLRFGHIDRATAQIW